MFLKTNRLTPTLYFLFSTKSSRRIFPLKKLLSLFILILLTATSTIFAQEDDNTKIVSFENNAVKISQKDLDELFKQKKLDNEIFILGNSHPEGSAINERSGAYELLINSFNFIQEVIINKVRIKINNSNVIYLKYPFQFIRDALVIEVIVIAKNSYSIKTFSHRYEGEYVRPYRVKDGFSSTIFAEAGKTSESNPLFSPENNEVPGASTFYNAFLGFETGGYNSYKLNLVYHQTEYDESDELGDLISPLEITLSQLTLGYKGTDIIGGIIGTNFSYSSIVSKNKKDVTNSELDASYLTYIGFLNLGVDYSFLSSTVLQEEEIDLRYDSSGIVQSVNAIADLLFLDEEFVWANKVGRSTTVAKDKFVDSTSTNVESGFIIYYSFGFFGYKYKQSDNVKALFNPSYDLIPATGTSTHTLSAIINFTRNIGIRANYKQIKKTSNVEADNSENIVTSASFILTY